MRLLGREVHGFSMSIWWMAAKVRGAVGDCSFEDRNRLFHLCFNFMGLRVVRNSLNLVGGVLNMKNFKKFSDYFVVEQGNCRGYFDVLQQSIMEKL